MVDECSETRIHGLVYDQHAVGLDCLGWEAHRLGWKAMPFALDDLDSNCASQNVVSLQRYGAKRTFVSMVGYVLEDMLMEVFIEPKPQLHTSRYGLCAIAGE